MQLKKVLAVVLSVVMILGVMPFAAFATDLSTGFNVGGNSYETFAQALANAQNGDTITLVDVTSLGSTDIAINKDITVDFGDCVVNVARWPFVNNANLTLEGTTGGLVSARGLVDNYGTLTINSGVYDNTAIPNPALWNNPDAVIVINGGTISSNHAVVYNEGATLTINDGVLNSASSSKVSSSYYSYAIRNLPGSSCEMNGGTISAVHGGIAIFGDGVDAATVVVNDGTITTHNSEAGNDAFYPLYVSGNGTSMTVNGGTFSGPRTAVMLDDDDIGLTENTTLNINGGTFTAPSGVAAVTRGDNDSYPVITGGTFSSDVSAYLATGYEQDPETGAVALGDYVAKIGNVAYETLEAAVEASEEGATIELLNDVDLSGKYGRSTAAYIFNLRNRTLDLKGYTISMYNHGAGFQGDNMVIKNGNFACVPTPSNVKTSYALPIYPEVFTRQSGTSSDLNTVTDKSTGVVLEDLVLNPGGLNIKGSEVTCKNLEVTGSYYYGVSGEFDSVITIESGSYTTTNSTGAVLNTSNKTDGSPKLDDYTVFYVKGGSFQPTGSAKIFNTGINSDHYVVTGGFYKTAANAVYTVPVQFIDSHYAQDMTTGEVIQAAAVDGTNITVAETISENFYLDDEFYGDEAYVAVSYNHSTNVSETPNYKTDVKALSSLPEYDGEDADYAGYRLLSIMQAPAQATEDITVKVYANETDAKNDENVLNSYTYSAYSYCSEIIGNDNYPVAVQTLAEATLDYAAASQAVFNYNTENLATKDNGNSFYGEVDSVDFTEVAGISNRPDCIKYVTFVVKSDLEVNLLSLEPITVNGVSMDTDKGGARLTATDHENGDFYVVHIGGIEPANMNKTITVQTTQGDIVLTANALIKIMAQSSDADMATLARAMYLYGVAANGCFGA